MPRPGRRPEIWKHTKVPLERRTIISDDFRAVKGDPQEGDVVHVVAQSHLGTNHIGIMINPRTRKVRLLHKGTPLTRRDFLGKTEFNPPKSKHYDKMKEPYELELLEHNYHPIEKIEFRMREQD
jgi:hypothetical protein